MLLSVKNLKAHISGDGRTLKAVDGVSFSLARGEALGLVGESGCGKTMLALSLMRLVPEPQARIVAGEVLLDAGGGRGPADIVKLSEREMRKIRGGRIAMVFQEPMTALNPVHAIGDQIAEAIGIHLGGSRKQRRARAVEMLSLVGIPAPESRARCWPHQLSGGMRQRAMIAMALSCRPDILIADEPTASLDLTIQAQILDLIARLQRELGMALILVTHDLGVVAEAAERVIVMYAGQLVEEGTAVQIFREPRHPYTQGLLKSRMALGRTRRGGALPTIGGGVPDLSDLPAGCYFADRCPKVKSRCRLEAVPEDPCGVGRLVRCFYA